MSPRFQHHVQVLRPIVLGVFIGTVIGFALVGPDAIKTSVMLVSGAILHASVVQAMYPRWFCRNED